jgi:hypothetical protein
VEGGMLLYGGTDVMERSCAVARGKDINTSQHFAFCCLRTFYLNEKYTVCKISWGSICILSHWHTFTINIGNCGCGDMRYGTVEAGGV